MEGSARDIPAQGYLLNPEIVGRLATLNFRPHLPDSMKVWLEDVKFVAVVHPLRGLALLWNFSNGRTVASGEMFLPIDAPADAIARAMLDVFKACHPERNDL
jgi:hypothetical protein